MIFCVTYPSFVYFTKESKEISAIGPSTPNELPLRIALVIMSDQIVLSIRKG